MKTVILAGGYGTRLSEYTKKIPKPMVKIGPIPILEHIMNYYRSYGHNDFVIALGYKKNIIKNYFSKKKFKNINIKLVDTGKHSLTGTRLKKLKSIFVENENFFLTYGDGLSNVNLDKLLKFHERHGKVCTITAVRPSARFGEIFFNSNLIKKFQEKPQVTNNWINGGFMVCNYRIFDFLPAKNHMLEREPFKKLTSQKKLSGFKHYDFWQCMDTIRDRELLNKLYKSKNTKWIKK